MGDRDEHERQLAELLELDTTQIKSWLDGMRAFAKDGSGKTIMLGLTALETLEFLRLNPIYYATDDRGRSADCRRYMELREKHDLARIKDAGENLAHWSAGTGKAN